MTNPLTSSAQRLRVVLILAIVLALIAGVAAIVYSIGVLNAHADKVNDVAIEASESDGQLEKMRNEAMQLDSFQEPIDRAKRIVANSQDYAHQDVIIRDLERFASQANIRVQSYDFTAGEVSTKAPKSTSVSITIQNPVNYLNLLRFMHSIEQNLTKMQISGVSINRISEGSGSNVNSSNLTIEVFIR